jgi:Zn-dependent protease
MVMSESLACPQGHDTLDATAGRCEACGVTFFHWRDGLGQTWRVEACPEVVRLVALGTARLPGETEVQIERPAASKAITYSPTGNRLVIHFDTGKREIGFSIAQDEAARFLAAVGAGQPVAAEPRSLAPLPSAGREVRRKDSPTWPKMSAAAITALLAACLAFLPAVGLIFLLISAICATVALRRSRPNASYAHIRTMARLSLVIAVTGAAIGSLAAWVIAIDVRELSYDVVVERISLIMGADFEWSWGARIAAFVAIIIGLSVHEASHAISAWWYGDGLAKSMGRVTLNPLSHIDPFGTIVLPLMLTLSGAPAFGYARPVPTQLGEVRKYWRAQALVAAAGPVSNLLQACLCLAGLMLMGLLLRFLAPGAEVSEFSSINPFVEIKGMAGGKVLAGLALLLKLGFQVNVFVAFFNLIPVPPLDGSWIAQYLSPGFIRTAIEIIRPYGFLLFLALLWFGYLEVLLTPAYYVLAGGHILLAITTGM